MIKIVKKFTAERKKIVEVEMNKIKYEEENINTELLKLDKELEQAKNIAPGSSVLSIKIIWLM